MKVLIADKFEESGRVGLQQLGAEVLFQPDLSGASLADALRRSKADVLVVRGTKVDAAMFDGSALRLIVRAGSGLNTIDVEGAGKRGIAVANCPGLNSIAVAELTMGLIVALDRRIPDNVAELRAGHWNKKEFSRARGLFGRTLGILGYGVAGAEVTKRALAFGMRVVVWSRRFAGGRVEGVEPGATVMSSPEDVAAVSNVLSLHLALTPETRGLVNRRVLERLKPGAYFVNTARAEVVDRAALEDAIRNRGLRVATDVFAMEPADGEAPFHDPLLELPGVIGTHHIGGSTDQAQEAIAQEVVRIIRDWSEADDDRNPHS